MFFMSLMCCKTIATFLWRSIDNFQSNFGTSKLFNKKSECAQTIYFKKTRYFFVKLLSYSIYYK